MSIQGKKILGFPGDIPGTESGKLFSAFFLAVCGKNLFQHLIINISIGNSCSPQNWRMAFLE